MQNADAYGNNTNFSDTIMSDITTKGLLGKWTAMILADTENALQKYYIKDRNIDAGDKGRVAALFRYTDSKIAVLTPVLEDLVTPNISGIEDIFIAVYGVASDEVYILRSYRKLAQNVGTWDEDYMWNNCSSDRRLRHILAGVD